MMYVKIKQKGTCDNTVLAQLFKSRGNSHAYTNDTVGPIHYSMDWPGNTLQPSRRSPLPTLYKTGAIVSTSLSVAVLTDKRFFPYL